MARGERQSPRAGAMEAVEEKLWAIFQANDDGPPDDRLTPGEKTSILQWMAFEIMMSTYCDDGDEDL